MNTDFVGGKEASKLIGVHQRTLYLWESKGLIETIRTPGGKRLYNVTKFINEKRQYIEINENKIYEENKRYKICYVRVSTNGQKDDLYRQIKYMTEKYPNYEIIQDIGSGINFNRKGLNKILDMAISGNVELLVVAHKDRLTRFGFELIERLITKYSKGSIKIENEKREKEPQEEIVEDILQLMNVFVARMNGLRKYKNK